MPLAAAVESDPHDSGGLTQNQKKSIAISCCIFGFLSIVRLVKGVPNSQRKEKNKANLPSASTRYMAELRLAKTEL